MCKRAFPVQQSVEGAKEGVIHGALSYIMTQAGTAALIADVISDLIELGKSGRLPQGSFLSFPTGYGFRV
jgi:hypothetical protein